MESLLTFENLLTALSALIVAGLWAYRVFSKHSAEMKSIRIGQIHSFTTLAYGAVSELARLTPTQIDDKVALALGKVNEQLAAAGAKPLAASEVPLVKPLLDSLHVDEKRTAALP